MIRENIDSLIASAMKNDKERVETLRAIKNEFLVYKTGKDSKPMTDEIEVTILKRMVKQRQGSIEQYRVGNREDLVEKEEKEIRIISEYLPKPITEDDIRNVILELCIEHGWVKNIEGTEYSKEPVIPKKSMGEVIRYVKSKLLGVDGGVVSSIVKNYLE